MLAATFDGKAEPCASHNHNDPTEKDLPLTVSRAITRAMTWRTAEFADLNLSDRSMLVEVLRCVSRQHASQSVFIRRDTLAVRLACSIATVGRMLARLEELGWIVRDQVKSRIRGFQVGSIALTQLAVRCLALDTPDPVAQRRSHVSDACSYSSQSLQRHQPAAGSVDKSTQKTKPPAASRLPTSLQWLLEKITVFGVFRLMGEARKRGQRLEDLTSQCEVQLRQSDNWFAYVQHLLSLGKDWAYIASQARSAQVSAAGEGATQLQFQTDLRLLDGQDFIATDGHIRKVRGAFVEVFSATEAQKPLGVPMGSRPLDAQFVADVQTMALRPWSQPAQPLDVAAPTAANAMRSGGRGEGVRCVSDFVSGMMLTAQRLRHTMASI